MVIYYEVLHETTRIFQYLRYTVIRQSKFCFIFDEKLRQFVF